MSKLDKSLPLHKIDKKWVREEKRTFSEYPGLPGSNIVDEENWLKLLQFYRDDVKWLLSLDHHKFWSQMIYSEKVHEFLISFLKKSPPVFLKNNILAQEDLKNLFSEIEHLVFLVYLRLSTEKESESCYVRNFGDIIYNNYLFTVPVILDICLVYGTTNIELVRRMINNVITAAPDFLDDFQEIIPQFVLILKTVKEKLLLKHEAMLEKKLDTELKEVSNLVLYFYDTVATIQVFFELYPNICQLFNKSELISEIIYFYSNVMPAVYSYWSKRHPDKSLLALNLIEYARIDLLKIIKSIFDFVLNEINEMLEKNEEILTEYLELVKKLLSEPVFLFDYNLIYSIEYELAFAVRNCKDVESIKINQILQEILQMVNEKEGGIGENIKIGYSYDSGVKLNSLVTEIKDIFPHLEEDFIRQCLNYYDHNTEKVIAAILENLLPLDLHKHGELKEMLEFRGKHKNKHESLNKMLNDKEDISRTKEKYMHLSFVIDEIYDDEYDDTYDENADVSLREGDEMLRRPFVIPRILRAGRDNYDSDNSEEEDEEEEIMKKNVDREIFGKDNFIENPAVLREWIEQRRLGWSSKNVAGSVRGRGQGQSKQILRNREFKESHKSLIANHNRKKLSFKKMS